MSDLDAALKDAEAALDEWFARRLASDPDGSRDEFGIRLEGQRSSWTAMVMDWCSDYTDGVVDAPEATTPVGALQSLAAALGDARHD